MKRYWKEIAAILIIKAILLTVIWCTFFSHPLILNNETAGAHILEH